MSEGAGLLSFTVPVRTASALNERAHWAEKAGRVKRERDAVYICWGRRSVPVPCSVLMTRVAPGEALDDDNLAGALKGARDEVARLLGVDDADSRVTWMREQEQGEWGVRISIAWPADGTVLPVLPRRPEPKPRAKKSAPRRILAPTPAVYRPNFKGSTHPKE